MQTWRKVIYCLNIVPLPFVFAEHIIKVQLNKYIVKENAYLADIYRNLLI
jgi:hypothetical protein